MDRIGGHCREIRAQDRGESRYDHAVAKTRQNGNGPVKQVVHVLKEVRAGNRRKAFGQLAFGTGRIYNQYIEPEKAEEHHQYKNDISDSPADAYSEAFFFLILIRVLS